MRLFWTGLCKDAILTTMNRILRIFIEIIGGFLILAVVGIAVLMGRLQQGPLLLNDALPELESLLDDMIPGFTLKIANAQLEANEQYRSVQMRVNGIQFLNENGQRVGKLQQVMLGYNWRNLTSLSIMPVAMTITRPVIAVTRFPNGVVGFNFQEENQDKPDPKVGVEEISKFFRNAPHALRHIRVVDAVMLYDDQMDNYRLAAYDGVLDFHRNDDEVNGTMSLNIKTRDFNQKIKGTISYDVAQQAVRVTMGIKKLLLQQARHLVEKIPADLQFDMPVNILATALIDDKMRPVKLDLQVTGEKGSLQYPPYFPQAVPMSDLMLSAHYLPDDHSLQLETLTTKIEDFLIAAKGDVRFVTEQEKPVTKVALRATADNVPVDKLKTYWPQGMGTNARDWVTVQIQHGVAEAAGVDVKLSLPQEGDAVVEALDGKIRFRDLTVDYLPPMPPVKNVSGNIVFNKDYFDIDADSGTLFDSKVVDGKIRIRDLLTEDPKIGIKLDIDGPVQDAITTISSKPLEYAQQMGMKAEQFSGMAKTGLELDFPLLTDLKIDQVEMKARAELSDLVAKNIVRDLTVSGKSMVLDVDTHHLALEGDAVLADGPAHLKWQEFFGDDAENATIVDLTGAMTPAVLRGLRVPADTYFTGSAVSQVNVTIDREKNTDVTVSADLANAQIDVPPLGTKKARGVAGNLNLKVVAAKDGVTTISDVNASWPNFSVEQGMARWDAKQNLQSATLKNLRSGRTKANVVVTPNMRSGATQIVVKGDTVDVSNAWAEMQKPSDPKAPPSTQLLDISVRANKLYLDPELPFTNIKADLMLKGPELIRANVAGKVANKGDLVLQQVERGDKSRQLYIKAVDAGTVLAALDMLDVVYGGTLLVNGTSTPQKPSEISGALVLSQFSLVKAPIMARLLNAMSPGGLLNLLNGKGLYFQKMQSDFVMPDAKTIRLKKGKMSGDSLGLSFSGTVYRDTQTLSLKGTIVPMEGINKFASKIPLLGTILTGFKGEGVIGATYTVKGPSDNPNVSVNPLSALTPGILRSILFEGSDD